MNSKRRREIGDSKSAREIDRVRTHHKWKRDRQLLYLDTDSML